MRGGVLHLECPSGIAGDMFLGACLDLGAPDTVLADVAAGLGLEGVGVETRRTTRGGVSGVRVRVLESGRPIEGPDPDEPHHPHQAHEAHRADEAGSPQVGDLHVEDSHGHGHRNLDDILRILGSARLEASVTQRAAAMFNTLAEVEGAIHGVAPNRVHFHEVGAIDAMVDIVGACAMVEYLAPQRITCGTVVVGSGTARTAHGVVPIPAPATARLLEGIPTRGDGSGELTTPTGALILRSFVDAFCAQPAMRAAAHGYGLGRRELSDRANALRIAQGEPLGVDAGADGPVPAVTVVECAIDDLSPEGCAFAVESLLADGALDVFVTPVVMKKGRPGNLVTLLCREPDRDRLARRLLRETGSLGCRFYRASRLEAEREFAAVRTVYGTVRVKLGRLDDELVVRAPEYEDCRRLALERGLTWREVYAAALAACGEIQERRLPAPADEG